MSGNIRLREAIQVFDENFDEILLSLTHNLNKKLFWIEVAHACTLTHLNTDTEIRIAEEAHKLKVEEETEEMAHSLKALVRYKNAKNSTLSPYAITDEDIAHAKEEPIQNLYSGRLRKQGVKLWGCCPFHSEDTPSFIIDTNKNNWHCFGCNTGGDSIDFYARLNNLDSKKDFIKIIKALI